MTDPLPSMQSPSEPIVYQPISGWAIAGFATGCFFALLVVVSAGVAFYQGAPFFYPDFIMVVPIAGVGLSYYGQRHVLTSEGTRAGANLARWGVRLSLVVGLVYFSYYYVTRFAVSSQANDFVMKISDDDSGFIERLLAGSTSPTQHNAAFLLTQAPNARGPRPENELAMRERYDKPAGKDNSAGILTHFREKEVLPRILHKQRREDVEITPLSVMSWEYEKRSYKIFRSYHVKTKEIEVDYVLAVFSVEGETAGQGRKWFIDLTKSGPIPNTTTLTRFGEGLVHLRQSAIESFAMRFVSLQYLDNEAFADGAKLDKTNWSLLSIEESKREERRTQVHNMLARDGDLWIYSFNILSTADEPGRWEHVDGKIRMFPMLRFALRKNFHQPPIFHYEAVATLETKQAIDPAKYEPGMAVDWNVIEFNVVAVAPLPELGPDAKKLPPQAK